MKGTTTSRGMRARLSLATSLMTGLALLCLAMLVLAHMHSTKLRNDQANLRKLTEALTSLDLNGLAANLAAMDAIVDRESGTDDKELVEEVDAAAASAKETFLALSRNPAASSEVQSRLAEASAMFEIIAARSHDVVKLVSARSKDEKAFGDLDDEIDTTRVKMSEILTSLRAKAAANETANDKRSEETSLWTLGALTLIIMCLIGASLMIVRRSSNKISLQIENASEALGHSGSQVERETSELERQTLVLTATVSEQAAGVTETVAAMTEIQSILKRNTESLAAASRSLSESAESSSVGLRQSNLMAQALSDLNTASSELERIVDIVNKISAKTEVINAIVFKTQVLAFNASIEASRAGEHGKGFSAVAQEVGRLADLSGQAAGEIGTLLDSSKSQVNKILSDVTRNLQTTIMVSDQVRSHFEGLAGRVTDISRSVADVSMGAKEQLTGIEQCSRAMTEMNAATQEVNHVSVNINEQCNTLRSCVTTIQNSTSTLSYIVRGRSGEFTDYGAIQAGIVAQTAAAHRGPAGPAMQRNGGALPAGTPGTARFARPTLSEDAKAAMLLERFRSAGNSVQPDASASSAQAQNVNSAPVNQQENAPSTASTPSTTERPKRKAS
jgi:methyl-accepting chemotaxis protein